MGELIYWAVILFTVVCFMVEYTKGDGNDIT
jgi:hypothetical protein